MLSKKEAGVNKKTHLQATSIPLLTCCLTCCVLCLLVLAILFFYLFLVDHVWPCGISGLEDEILDWRWYRILISWVGRNTCDTLPSHQLNFFWYFRTHVVCSQVTCRKCRRHQLNLFLLLSSRPFCVHMSCQKTELISGWGGGEPLLWNGSIHNI